MDLVLSCFSKGVSCLILTLAIFYMWSKLNERKINFKDYKVYLSLFIIVIFSIFNYYIVNQFIRIVVITIFLGFNFWYIFRESLKETVITSIISQTITMIAEMIFAIIISCLFGLNSEDIVNTQFGQFLGNLIISIMILLIVNIPIIKKAYKSLIKATDKVGNNQLVITSFILIIFANLLTMVLYYQIEFIYLLIFNTLLTIFCLIIVIYSFKTKSKYMKVSNKYNTTINSLKEYDDILDKYRISNHENENQLLTIRNMLPEKDKKAISYIDNLVKTNIKDNGEVMFDVSKIPAGGLRGLIYSKVLEMKELNIDYELEISNSVKTVDLINIDDLLMLDICKVIGVYLDNAIQAVQNLEEKYINIEMYLDENDLVISILNNYSGQIMIDKIEQKGYTSKGKGHGYGLTLAKKIIDSNDNLINEKGISRDSFSQTLKIKL